ncbi:hypothetical protein ACFL7D_11630 [candidate division KSB1 bacterium]
MAKTGQNLQKFSLIVYLSSAHQLCCPSTKKITQIAANITLLVIARSETTWQSLRGFLVKMLVSKTVIAEIATPRYARFAMT